ncbi:hypothetical protein E2C01_033977 [Portunus trituberculatus]|uniref:Uncharacterized protein n=1 Tax=Portunus trituberculatus TaxID=210409 RepID=A0A5B7EZA9_PORTR|nr:hypothetical protein [Portunus trituberculatus]
MTPSPLRGHARQRLKGSKEATLSGDTLPTHSLTHSLIHCCCYYCSPSNTSTTTTTTTTTTATSVIF